MNPTFSHSRILSFPHFLIFTLSLFLLSTFSSCSIEKRRYMDGYHIQWKKRTESAEESAQHQTPENKTATSDQPAVDNESIVESTSNKTETNNISSAAAFDSSTTNIINNKIFVKPTKTTTPSGNKKISIFQKITQDPTDPEVLRKYERNKTLIFVGLVLGFSLLGVAFVLAIVAIFNTILQSGNSSPQLEHAILITLFSGLGLTIMGIIAAIAQAVLKGKYPGLGYKKEKSKNAENKYVEEPKYNVGEPQPISDEVRKRHNILYWSSTLLGTLFFIITFFSYAIIKDGGFWGLVQPGIGQILFSLGLIGLCFFLLWSWVKLRKKKKAYLEEHPELLVIPSK